MPRLPLALVKSGWSRVAWLQLHTHTHTAGTLTRVTPTNIISPSLLMVGVWGGGADVKNLKPLALICRPLPFADITGGSSNFSNHSRCFGPGHWCGLKMYACYFPFKYKNRVYTRIKTEKEKKKRMVVVRLFFSKVKGISFILKVHRYPEE